MSPGLDSILHALSGRGLRKATNGWEARCPSHEDNRPSLAIAEGAEGRVLVKCHAGCETKDVLAALGLGMETLSGDVRRGLPMERTPDSIVYDYKDEAGHLRFQVVRKPGKKFLQRRPDGKNGWHWNLEGVDRVLYRLPELLASNPDQTVYIVEGEKDVETLRSLGQVATTNSGGAGKWRAEYSASLRNRHVVILPDNDDPGRQHADMVADSLAGVAASVRVVSLPGLPIKGDVSDWITAGGTMAKLEALVKAGPLQGATPTPPPIGEDFRKPRKVEEEPWPPPLAREAFHGLIGKIVEAIAPHTESDPVAILVQLLAAVGNCIGRGPHFLVEQSRHYPVLFAVLVGTSAKARKGTSWDHVRRLLSEADPGWADSRIQSGLSSGEGVIWHIREPIEELRPEKGGKGAMVRVQVDEGVKDKRLMVVESEFGSVLKVATREGNTLTGVLRQAWDGVNLKTLTKNNSCEARNPHISVIGHTTREDLLRYLDRTDAANGFGNRFLWLCVKRSKLLPDGGSPNPEGLASLTTDLRMAVQYAQKQGESVLPRDGETASIWRRVYGELSEGKAGLCGAMLGRGDAQVVRLSLLYALVDRSPEIRRPHLEAALALWEYAEASARYIFGGGLGDKTADEILRMLTEDPDGMTRTEISHAFGGHRARMELSRALGMLERNKLAYAVSEKTGGRPGERWFAGPGEISGESEQTTTSSASFASFAGAGG